MANISVCKSLKNLYLYNNNIRVIEVSQRECHTVIYVCVCVRPF